MRGGNTFRPVRTAYMLAFCLLTATAGARANDFDARLAEAAKGGQWVVTVEQASGLPDLDPLRGRGTSDPFVKVYAAKRKGQTLRCLGTTRVIHNNGSPAWEQDFTVSGGADALHLLFNVWDKDKLADRNIGLCGIWNARPGQLYRLNLYTHIGQGIMARMLEAVPADESLDRPFGRVLPGTLFIRVERRMPTKPVPDVRGKTVDAARATLESRLFRCRVKRRFMPNPERVGQVFALRPSPGAEATLGSTVELLVGHQPCRRVPKVIGKPVRRARRALVPAFRRVTVTHQPPPIDTPRKRWMTVAEQSPKAGTVVPQRTPIALVAFRPPADYKITVPDVTGRAVKDARGPLRDAQVAGFRTKKQRSADPEDNGKILAQDPAPGTQLPWQSEQAVTLTVGWFADGSTLQAATPTKPGAPFAVPFDREDGRWYRLLQVTDPGYLVATCEQAPGDLPLRCAFHGRDAKTGWHRAGPSWLPLPAARRVSAGTWAVAFWHEFGDTLDAPCRFTIRVVPEFDAAEPNDTPDQAVETAPNASLVLGLAGNRDKDRFQFTIQQPGYLEITAGDRQPPADEALADIGSERTLTCRVTDPAGEDLPGLGHGYPPCAVFLAPGDYGLLISSEGEDFDLARYPVDLRFHPAKDRGEPNDTFEQATEVKAGQSIPVCYDRRDADVYCVTSNGPGWIVLRHDRELAFDLGTRQYNADGNASQGTYPPPIAFRTDGRCWISLHADTHEHGYLVDEPAKLSFAFVPQEDDPSEPNDTPEQAAGLALDRTISALSLPRLETDWYRFTVAGDTGPVVFDLQPPADQPGALVPRLPLEGAVFAPNGTDKAVDALRFHEPVALATGTYLLRVRQEPGLRRLCLMPYTLTIRTRAGAATGEDQAVHKRYGDAVDAGGEDYLKYAYQAYGHLQRDEVEQAEQLYRKALEGLPEHPAIWNDLGVTLFKRKQTDAAKDAFTKAAALKDDYALPHRNLAVLAWERDDWRAGLDHAARAAALAPTDKNLRYAARGAVEAALAHERTARMLLLEKAAGYYKRMETLPPDCAERLGRIESILKQQRQ